MTCFGIRSPIYATTGREHEPGYAEPFTDVGYSKRTAVVTTIRKANVKIARGISNKPGRPDNRFTSTKMRKDFVPMWYINSETAKTRVIPERVESIVSKPVRIQRYDLKPLVDEIGTQCTSQISCTPNNSDTLYLLCHDVLLRFLTLALPELMTSISLPRLSPGIASRINICFAKPVF